MTADNREKTAKDASDRPATPEVTTPDLAPQQGAIQPVTGPTEDEAKAILQNYHDAAHLLLSLQLARTLGTDPARFELVKATLQAGGFARVETSFDQLGQVLDTGVWLSGPLSGTTELWNLADGIY